MYKLTNTRQKDGYLKLDNHFLVAFEDIFDNFGKLTYNHY